MRMFSDALRFPDYFGFNWDALDECLADLSWLEPGDVLIWHTDVPLVSEPRELGRYLQILEGLRQEPGTRMYTISFSEASRSALQKFSAS